MRSAAKLLSFLSIFAQFCHFQFYHCLTKKARDYILYKTYFTYMKPSIHPTYNTAAVVTCASCNTTWQTGSTKDKLDTEICSNCHPFYTGKQNLVDTAGTVERFKQKQAKAATVKAAITVKKPRKARAPKA